MGDTRAGNPDDMDHLASLLWTEGDGGAYGELTAIFTRARQLDASEEVTTLSPLFSSLYDTAEELRNRADILRRDAPGWLECVSNATSNAFSDGFDWGGATAHVVADTADDEDDEDDDGGITDMFGDGASALGDAFGDGARSVGEAFGDGADAVGGAADDALDFAGDLGDGWFDAGGSLFETEGDIFSDLTGIDAFDGIGDAFGNAMDDVGNAVDDAADSAGDAADDAADDVGDAAEDTGDDVGDSVDPDEDDDGLSEGDESGEEDDPDEVDGNEDFRKPPDEPVGEPKKRKDRWLKDHGVDPHEAKEDAGLKPPSHYDIYVDRDDNLWGVRKGEDPTEVGEYLGNLDDYENE